MKIKTNQNLVSQNQNAQLKSPIAFVAITSLICTFLAMDLLFFTYHIMTSLVLPFLQLQYRLPFLQWICSFLPFI
jgi:hypothetical protein